MNPDRIVREFCEAWNRSDVEAIVEAFTEDATYHNIPMEPCHGKAAIKEFLDGFLGGLVSEIHWEIVHQVVADNLVMNERIDTLVMESGTVKLPVCGVFELTNEGKISAWRDYFDMAPFSPQSP